MQGAARRWNNRRIRPTRPFCTCCTRSSSPALAVSGVSIRFRYGACALDAIPVSLLSSTPLTAPSRSSRSRSAWVGVEGARSPPPLLLRLLPTALLWCPPRSLLSLPLPAREFQGQRAFRVGCVQPADGAPPTTRYCCAIELGRHATRPSRMPPPLRFNLAPSSYCFQQSLRRPALHLQCMQSMPSEPAVPPSPTNTIHTRPVLTRSPCCPSAYALLLPLSSWHVAEADRSQI